MKFTKFLIASALSLLAHNAAAENLYRPGTQGHELAAYAEKVLPSTVSPYFVEENERSKFTGQLKNGAMDEIGISRSSQMAAPRIEVATTSDVTAMATYDIALPERKDRSLCTVVFIRPGEAKIGSTLMHELMHCRIQASEITQPYTEQVKRVIVLDPSLTKGKQLRMFEEVLARAMSFSFIVNHGIKEDGEFFKTRLSSPYPYNPGPLSVRRAVEICMEKGVCSVEPASLAKKLLDDSTFVTALKQDMRNGAAYDKKMGF